MLSIDQLPVEILMKIFRYLPNCGQVSLVNKLFYNVVCSLNDIFLELFLDSKTLVSKTLLKCVKQSIIESHLIGRSQSSIKNGQHPNHAAENIKAVHLSLT